MLRLLRVQLVPLGFVLALAAGLSTIARAQDADVHEIYERSCGGCHAPHAGEFARATLSVRDGRVVSQKSGRDVEAFLGQGHGGVSPSEASALVRQFRSILSTGGVFEAKCRICHDRAVVLARANLIVCDGKLRGRYSGKDTAEFLSHHGRLEPAEIQTMLAMFKRQLTTEVSP